MIGKFIEFKFAEAVITVGVIPRDRERQIDRCTLSGQSHLKFRVDKRRN
jgi:hypothetical protein